MWFKDAQTKETTYQLLLGGQLFSLSASQISDHIKKKLKSNFIIRKLFKKFGIDLNELDNLSIKIMPLAKQYALTDDKEMKLDESLFKKRNDFFEKHMFLPAHEVVHFIKRLSEKKSYLADSEEVLGFATGIAYCLSNGKSIQDVWRDVFPKIKWHFNDQERAELFFKKCIQKAKKIAE